MVRRTRPHVPWERTRPLMIAEAAIALTHALRRIVRLFLAVKLNMMSIQADLMTDFGIMYVFVFSGVVPQYLRRIRREIF